MQLPAITLKLAPLRTQMAWEQAVATYTATLRACMRFTEDPGITGNELLLRNDIYTKCAWQKQHDSSNLGVLIPVDISSTAASWQVRRLFIPQKHFCVAALKILDLNLAPVFSMHSNGPQVGIHLFPRKWNRSQQRYRKGIPFWEMGMDVVYENTSFFQWAENLAVCVSVGQKKLLFFLSQLFKSRQKWVLGLCLFGVFLWGTSHSLLDGDHEISSHSGLPLIPCVLPEVV